MAHMSWVKEDIICFIKEIVSATTRITDSKPFSNYLNPDELDQLTDIINRYFCVTKLDAATLSTYSIDTLSTKICDELCEEDL